MKTSSVLIHRLQLVFGSAILALLLAGTISYLAAMESAESDRTVRHTQEVLENLLRSPGIPKGASPLAGMAARNGNSP